MFSTFGCTVTKCYEIFKWSTSEIKICNMLRDTMLEYFAFVGLRRVRILPILPTLVRAFAQLQVYTNIILTLACYTKLSGTNNEMHHF